MESGNLSLYSVCALVDYGMVLVARISIVSVQMNYLDKCPCLVYDYTMRPANPNALYLRSRADLARERVPRGFLHILCAICSVNNNFCHKWHVLAYRKWHLATGDVASKALEFGTVVAT